MKMPSKNMNSTENPLQKLTGVPRDPAAPLRNSQKHSGNPPETFRELPMQILSKIMQSIETPLENPEIYRKSFPESTKRIEILSKITKIHWNPLQPMKIHRKSSPKS